MVSPSWVTAGAAMYTTIKYDAAVGSPIPIIRQQAAAMTSARKRFPWPIPMMA